MELVVPDDKLSLAIGKKGQNVRLASQLTGWRIDIHSETKMREAEARARASLSAIEGVGVEGAEALFRDGWGSSAQIAGASLAELTSVLGSEDKARKVQVAARAAAEVEATQARELAASRRIDEEAAAIAAEVELAASAGAAQRGEADQA
jgi:N utilization substance protein A